MYAGANPACPTNGKARCGADAGGGSPPGTPRFRQPTQLSSFLTLADTPERRGRGGRNPTDKPVQFSGRMPASQAGGAGSIPVTGSIFIKTEGGNRRKRETGRGYALPPSASLRLSAPLQRDGETYGPVLLHLRWVRWCWRFMPPLPARSGTMKIEVPDQESQFRLLQCRNCGSTKPGYQESCAGERLVFRVKCGGCGQLTPWWGCKHDAQMDWNQRFGKGDKYHERVKSQRRRNKNQDP